MTLTGFAPHSSVSISCRDSADTNGFSDFRIKTDTQGRASTQSYCYSADGPDHWVVADRIESIM
jgi:hypothetical protein